VLTDPKLKTLNLESNQINDLRPLAEVPFGLLLAEPETYDNRFKHKAISAATPAVQKQRSL